MVAPVFSRISRFVFPGLSMALVPFALPQDLPVEVVAASYLGSSWDQDAVVGLRIASDGTLVLAANIGDAVPRGVRPVDLAGFSTPSTPPPVKTDFSTMDEYRDAAEAWIRANVPNSPAAPTIGTLTEEAESEDEGARPLSQAEAVKRLPGARDRFIETWQGGWAGGAVLRLSPDGRRVLSLLRVGPRVEDLALDAQDRIYIAAGPSGAFRIEKDGVTPSPGWPKLANEYARRIDAGQDGHCVVLSGNQTGDVTVFDPAGRELLRTRGYRRTEDVAINTRDGLIYHIGWEVSRTWAQDRGGWSNFPVHIANLVAKDFRGSQKWLAYGWERHPVIGGLKESPTDWVLRNVVKASEAALQDRRTRDALVKEHLPEIHRFPVLHPQVNPRWLNRADNNMADARGCRVALGRDGKLYASFEVAGGNHAFRYDPFDITKRVTDKMPRVDEYHTMANTRSSHKGVVGRYDPETGQVEALQQFNTMFVQKRVPVANAFRMSEGAITADETGRVFLAGGAPSGLPIRYSQRFGDKTTPPNFNPFGREGQSSGAYLMVMSPGLDQRLFTTRLSESGYSHAVDARVINGGLHVAWAGRASLNHPSFTTNALQPEPGWGREDGFVAVLGDRPARAEVRNVSKALFGPGTLQDLRPDSESVVRSLDLNGDRVPDQERRMGFHPGKPLYSGTGGNLIHGGWVSQFSAAASPAGNIQGQLVASDKGGLYRRSGFPNGLRGEASERFWALVYQEIKGPGQRLGLNRGSEISFNGNPPRADTRVLLRDGDAWFLSEQNLSTDPALTFATDANDGRWAPIDPAALLRADELPGLLLPLAIDENEDGEDGKDDPRYSPRNFQNITAFGLVLIQNWANRNQSFGINDLRATFAVDPMDDPAPVAKARANLPGAARFEPIAFDAGLSTDDRGRPSFYSWRFGQEGTLSGPQVTHRFQSAGRHEVILTVWDENGASHQDRIWVDISLDRFRPAPGLQTVAAWGGSLGKHAGIGMTKGPSLHYRRLSDTPLFGNADAWGANVVGAATAVMNDESSSVFFDTSNRTMGGPLRPLDFWQSALRSPDLTVLVALPSSAFLGGASAADLRRGELYAGNTLVQKGAVHWAIHTPGGWRISQKPATRGSEKDSFRQAAAEVVWLAWNPVDTEDIRPNLDGSPVVTDLSRVTAIGFVLRASGGRVGFSSLAASGLPIP